jgi:predicted HD phosphohydrolase
VSVMTSIGTTVDEVLALVDELEEVTHGGRDLRTHALVGAGLAMAAGADDALVAATLLHDVGRARYLVRAAPGVPHEEVGRRFVEPRFGERAGWLVGQHVRAARYLATIDDAYAADLPPAARSALRRHGGVLPPRQVAGFESHAWAGDAVALRRFADAVLRGEGDPAPTGALAVTLTRAWRT